ncbi:MAG: multiheme c-type cytochrome [bacterium]
MKRSMKMLWCGLVLFIVFLYCAFYVGAATQDAISTLIRGLAPNPLGIITPSITPMRTAPTSRMLPFVPPSNLFMPLSGIANLTGVPQSQQGSDPLADLLSNLFPFTQATSPLNNLVGISDPLEVLRTANQLTAIAIPGATPYFYYEDPLTCAGGPGLGMCHGNKFAQWETDQHARAWTGDFMVAQYYDLARPDGDLDPIVADIKKGCVGCHSPSAFMALGDELLVTAPPRPLGIENAWNILPGTKIEADRGVFCDFCHTIAAVGTPPVNFNYSSAVTAAIDPKRGPLLPFNIPGPSPHDVIISPLHDDPRICGTCHDEIDPFGQMVKGTYTEWLISPYFPDVRCQDCHQALEGLAGIAGAGPQLYSMNFKGGFSPWVEGVASVGVIAPINASPGQLINFAVLVNNQLVGHYFPSGSEEERQLWLHVTATDVLGNIWHIPITIAPDIIDPGNPNHTFWVTTNAPVAWPSPNPAIGVPIPRDGLPEGDRIYHSIFVSPPYTGSKITYAQYYAAEIYSNRLRPLEPREEQYLWTIPPNAVGPITITADLNYRRMPDSMADFLGIMRRPIILVNRAQAIINLI